jgi:ribosomal protein S18 acetylase RimI-like enzyme
LIGQAQVQVRHAQPADDAALAELDASAWTPESGFPSVKQASRGRATFFTADNPPDAHLVAVLSGRVVGYIRLKAPTHLPENAHVIQVQGLAVHPGAQRQGAATALLTAAEQWVRDRGTRKLSLRVLGTNRVALGLYERLGFIREGVLREEFLINGSYVDDVLMTKHLGRQA